MILQALRERARAGQPIRVAVVGAGSMGAGIAQQVGATPGMTLVAVVDVDLSRAAAAAALSHPETGSPAVVVSTDVFSLLDGNPLAVDVLVEATNTVGFAARAVASALRSRIHVVLMNAEVDLLLGPWLHDLAQRSGVLISSDAGDQHGVLMRMIEEIRLWGLDIAMAGIIKGFLDRRATRGSIAEEARIRALNPVQCVAYTDGTKLNIEMALVANATGLVPSTPGMLGPQAADVHEVFDRFEFARHRQGVVDYILGAKPGGGVFVVGRSDDELQRSYLAYYKMGKGPFYLFYRPFHLCHLETAYAIGRLVLFGSKILEPACGKLAEVGAFAKRDLPNGTRFRHGIGSDELYGMIDLTANLEESGSVPIALLDSPDADIVVTLGVARDEPLGFADLELPDSPLLELYHSQQAVLAANSLR